MSNAGGYHSTKDYFKNINNNLAVKKISEFSQLAVEIAEKNDFSKSIKHDKLSSKEENAEDINKLRKFDFSTDQEESWVSALNFCLVFFSKETINSYLYIPL